MAGITISFVRCIDNTGYEGMLDVGEIYQSLPTTEIEDAAGDLRIIDNEGEDYLYKKSRFVAVDPRELQSAHAYRVTANLNGMVGIVLRHQARARGVSVSALLREWIDERLDLPTAV